MITNPNPLPIVLRDATMVDEGAPLPGEPHGSRLAAAPVFGVAAIIEIDGVRFTSELPQNAGEAETINKALREFYAAVHNPIP